MYQVNKLSMLVLISPYANIVESLSRMKKILISPKKFSSLSTLTHTHWLEGVDDLNMSGNNWWQGRRYRSFGCRCKHHRETSTDWPKMLAL